MGPGDARHRSQRGPASRGFGDTTGLTDHQRISRRCLHCRQSLRSGPPVAWSSAIDRFWRIVSVEYIGPATTTGRFPKASLILGIIQGRRPARGRRGNRHAALPHRQSRHHRLRTPNRNMKVVRYWLLEAESGTFTVNREVDAIKWATEQEAHDMLTYERDHEVIDWAIMLANDPTAGRIYLVRHAHAGDRKRWAKADELRPISVDGEKQADSLRDYLSGPPSTGVYSSPYVRCVQTMGPLRRPRAEARGRTHHHPERATGRLHRKCGPMARRSDRGGEPRRTHFGNGEQTRRRRDSDGRSDAVRQGFHLDPGNQRGQGSLRPLPQRPRLISFCVAQALFLTSATHERKEPGGNLGDDLVEHFLAGAPGPLEDLERMVPVGPRSPRHREVTQPTVRSGPAG